jgi:O-antigen/teichoic acid export membrane protein
MGVMGILLGGLIANASIGIFLISYTLRHVRLSFSFKILFDMAKYGLPLMWTWFGMFIINYADRFLLQRLGSLSDVGIYALAYKFGMMPNFLVLGPFMMIWAPKRFELVNELNAKTVYTSIFTYFCFIQLFMGLGISVLVKDALILMSAPEFRSAYQYVPLILLSYIFYGVYIYIQFGVLFGKKTKYLAIATLTGAVLNVSGNYVLIPKYQVWGACVATLISISFILLFTYPFAQRLYKIPYQYSRLFKMILASVALYFFGHFVNADSVLISLLLKSCIVISFPLMLYFMNFYSSDELRKLGELFFQLIYFLTKKATLPIKKILGFLGRDNQK